VGAFVKEQWFAGTEAAHVEAVLFEFVGERLFDIKEHPINAWVGVAQAVENVINVDGVVDGAIEIGGQPVDVADGGDGANPHEPIKIPRGVVAAQFDLKTFQAVVPNPVIEENRKTILELLGWGIGLLEEVQTTYEMPGDESRTRGWEEEVDRVCSFERHVSFGRRLQVCTQIAVKELRGVSLIDGAVMQPAERVVRREVEGCAT
jgi:hypothetical protein